MERISNTVNSPTAVMAANGGSTDSQVSLDISQHGNDPPSSLLTLDKDYLTIRPAARKGYGSIAHEAKPNGLLTRGP